MLKIRPNNLSNPDYRQQATNPAVAVEIKCNNR